MIAKARPSDKTTGVWRCVSGVSLACGESPARPAKDANALPVLGVAESAPKSLGAFRTPMVNDSSCDRGALRINGHNHWCLFCREDRTVSLMSTVELQRDQTTWEINVPGRD